jgi:hypothetical protein
MLHKAHTHSTTPSSISAPQIKSSLLPYRLPVYLPAYMHTRQKYNLQFRFAWKLSEQLEISSSSSSMARQPYVGPGLPQKLLPAKVSIYCFFRFRDKSLFQGGVVCPTPNPRLSWRTDVFCQDCLP